MGKDIKHLADYSHIKKLASALWEEEGAFHGAAVMVGAGFSRCGASTGDSKKRLPLWSHFSSLMARELDVANPTDPLRLAEEYFAHFGKQALYDLVKKEINDVAWKPGSLYTSLLELPWSEVLTTNWDTLLERASTDVHQPVYSIVHRQEQLASERSPRIVKLHGTMNVTDDLVFTQEDYRKYPEKHAAFVNFARQVFIENELCLVGFSGDDPNFLQWAGWVRDQLSTHSRRIYLVGCLGLTAAKRKYLESIKVAPIDLSDLVEDYDDRDVMHSKAIEVFLRELKQLKPKPTWDWSPTNLNRPIIDSNEFINRSNNPSQAAASLEKQLPVLEADRKSYPGWLVCPEFIRDRLRNQIGDPYPSDENLTAMTNDSRAKLLYEIAWRHRVTHEVIHPWLAQKLFAVCDPTVPCSLSKSEQLEIALLLFKNSRWFDNDESRSVEKATAEILEKHAEHWPDCTNEVFYHRAVLARDKFDYPRFASLVEKISPSEPVWSLRKAALLAELGRFSDGASLVADAYRELLKQYRHDRTSIYVLSRLAWAQWLMRNTQFDSTYETVESLGMRAKESLCDPWTHIERVRDRVSRELERQRKRNEIEPAFEPGRYRDNSATVTFDSKTDSIHLLAGLVDDVGIPLQWENVNLLADVASRLVLRDDLSCSERLAIAIRAAHTDTSDSLKRSLRRMQIACLSQDDAREQLDRCLSAVQYWSSAATSGNSERDNFAAERLRVFVEALARLSVRASAERAAQVFRFALDLAKSRAFHHPWLFGALDHLLQYSLESIPKSQHSQLLLETLSFPLANEISLSIRQEEWPNPVIEISGTRIASAALDRRIDQIIDLIAPCSPRSRGALQRLIPLLDSGFLNEGERAKIAEKIWGESKGDHALPETGLLAWVLLKLPSNNALATQEVLRKHIFDASGDSLFEPQTLLSIVSAACANNVEVLPNNAQAQRFFDQLVAWRPSKNESDPFGLGARKENQVADLVGTALGRSVVPSLSVEAMTEENFQRLCAFQSEVGAPDSLIALAYFSLVETKFAEKIEQILRKSLRGNDFNSVANASFAVLKWTELSGADATRKLVSQLIDQICSMRTAGLSGLLWTANQMYNKGYLSTSQVQDLAEALPVVFDNADYQSVLPASRDAVSVSLVREACVRFARDILTASSDNHEALSRMLEIAKCDPLPEVRNACVD